MYLPSYKVKETNKDTKKQDINIETNKDIKKEKKTEAKKTNQQELMYIVHIVDKQTEKQKQMKKETNRDEEGQAGSGKVG